ncbi:MAG: 2-hydroxyacyl-CoA dehydratase [Candidatus Sabulitectum sp.]|nr:2-hydroxyacyl-CoA dehydratase [Candidatus Sabulitectum sp.]
MEKLSTRAKALYAQELSNLVDLRAAGKKTAAFVCSTFPPAVLAGLGLRPVRLPLIITTDREKNEKSLVRQDVCPLVMELLESIQTDCADVAIGMHTCDTTRRFFQESGRFSSIPVHQLQLPAVIGSASLKFFTSQVHRLCDDLVLNGISDGYNPEIAEEWYKNTIEAAEFVRSIMMNIPPLALQYVLHLFRISDPSSIMEKLKKLLRDSVEYQPKFTLLLSGGPISPGDDTVAEIVEEMGGALIPVNCTGFQMFPEGKPADYSPASISKMYFDSMKCVRCRPNDKTFDHLSDEVSSTSAHGLIMKSLVFCDLWFTEKVRVKERISVPVLVLNTGFSPGESERTAVRVEAFVQSLEVDNHE